MKISTPNENGVHCEYVEEIVASCGRSHAAVHIALCPDLRYRFSIHLMYSYGGFGGPIWEDSESFDSFQTAKSAGMEDLLRRWDKPFPSDPANVHAELRDLREQVESQIRQPSFL